VSGDHSASHAIACGSARAEKAYVRSLAAPLYHFVKWVRHCLRYDRYVQGSYSQEGEDRVLARIFGATHRGFFVDIGAHHPKRFSNTYLFYRRGWSGINVDAMPGSMRAFRRVRPRDVNLEIPILKERATLKYWQFNDPALNGFSPELSARRDGREGYKVIGATELEGLPLRLVLERHMPPRQQVIDFMSVDVEGLDLDVLQSNDWTRFRPKVVLVELLHSSLSRLADDPVHRCMAAAGYELFAKTAQTAFYLSDEYVRERAEEAE
jgi:hypothetical protein